MRRLVHTSAGWMELELTWLPGPGGLGVTVVLFGENGWESAKERWNEKYSEGSLAGAIETVSLPAGEAEEIARSTLEQWRGSGWEQAQMDASPRFLPVLVSTLGLATIGAAALVVVAAVIVIGLL